MAGSPVVSLQDLYSPEELSDETEKLYHFIDPDDTTLYDVITIGYPETMKLLTPIGDMTVWESFLTMADPDQKALVEAKKNHFDPKRIIVLNGTDVIDGNHHVVASIALKKSVKAIDLEFWRGTNKKKVMSVTDILKIYSSEFILHCERYNLDTGNLQLNINGKQYRVLSVPEKDYREFRKRMLRNKGRALQYLKNIYTIEPIIPDSGGKSSDESFNHFVSTMGQL